MRQFTSCLCVLALMVTSPSCRADSTQTALCQAAPTTSACESCCAAADWGRAPAVETPVCRAGCASLGETQDATEKRFLLDDVGAGAVNCATDLTMCVMTFGENPDMKDLANICPTVTMVDECMTKVKRACESNQGTQQTYQSLYPNVAEMKTKCATYKTEHGSQGVCGSHLTGDFGFFTSPGYPDKNYHNNMDCTWQINVKPPGKIRIKFSRLRLEPSCKNDYVQITSPGMLPVKYYCDNRTAPDPFLTAGSSAIVNFHADGHINNKGFNISFTKIGTGDSGCGGHLTGLTGVISSPGPVNCVLWHGSTCYHHNQICTWHVNVPSPARILFHFSRIRLGYTWSTCRYGYLVLEITSPGMKPVKYMCETPLEQLVTLVSSATVTFYSGSSGFNGKGFNITYYAVVPECGGYLTSDRGVITSPNSGVPGRVYCTWHINVIPSGKILFVLDSVKLDTTGLECKNDFIRIDSPGMTPFKVDCDSPAIPHSSVLTLGPRATVTFTSDSADSAQGFHIYYTTLRTHAPSACGGYWTSDTGDITSPGYPYDYPNNVDCTWQIEVAPPARIRFEFGHMRIEAGVQCEFDYLTITASGMKPYNLCGYGYQPPLLIQGSSATVTFHSNGFLNDKGFNIRYTAETGESDNEQLDHLEAKLKELSSKYHELTNTMTKVKQCKAASASFTAGYTGNPNPSREVKYYQVIYNDGGSYNATTGAFTCKIAGVYNFAVHVLSQFDNDNIVFNLVHNDKTVSTVYAACTYWSGAASTSMNLELAEGDTVFVQWYASWEEGVYHTSSVHIGHPPTNIFTGVLISAMCV